MMARQKTIVAAMRPGARLAAGMNVDKIIGKVARERQEDRAL